MKHIYTFGCPRSGTTYLWKLCRTVFAETAWGVDRIKEGNAIHPCNFDKGLLGLASLNNPVLVRIYRDPVDVFESFYGKRSELSANPWHGVNDDERIYQFIENERRNVAFQKAWYERVKPDWPLRLVEVAYEDLHTREGRLAFAEAMGQHVGDNLANNLWRGVDETWGSVPSREGRLSLGITESLLPEGMAERIRERICE